MIKIMQMCSVSNGTRLNGSHASQVPQVAIHSHVASQRAVADHICWAGCLVTATVVLVQSGDTA
jgi:hypothetical protein